MIDLLAINRGFGPVRATVIARSLDHGNAERFRRLLAPLVDAHHVVLDLAAVRYVDSSALCALRDRAEEIAKRGGTLELRGISHPVQFLLDLLGMKGMTR